VVGRVERDGLTLGYEVFGTTADARPTILLLPTWTIIHSRFWKMQVPYLARHFPVVTYDGPGNGMSDRSTDPQRYETRSVALDAAAVLDACGVERAVAVGLSRGARYALELATLRPGHVAGLVLIGPALGLAPPPPDRRPAMDRFYDAAPDHPTGWDRYNVAYWHAHYEDFARWFFGEAFSEPHSTKCIDDAVGWAMETVPSVLEAEARKPRPEPPSAEMLGRLRCPTLVVHGLDDRIQAHEQGVEAARLARGTLVSFNGSGHLPNVRDPVRFNLLVREFAERIPS
jgi:pimeloyl-ACP methyl ester carboxylesterase